jgi:serine phosphatase RsbU (regulator of sigma subunit)
VGTATVDLICIDLFTGRTVLYKYGAAPSYILKNGKVQRICGESQAVGLQTAPESAPDRIELKLTPGTVAVMVSDGVVPEEDGWLCRMLEQSRDPGSLSKQILKAAAEQTGVNDDMTAYVIEISKRQ